MASFAKPIPKIDHDSKKFWEGCNEEKLLLQYCNDCNHYIYYPRIVCPHCMSTNIEWKESSGKGKVYSYTIVRYGPPGFSDDVPYIPALVDLDEGVRMITNIVQCDLEDITCGMPVEVVFEQRDSVKLPLFKPSN
ncbi:Zn-ribbon domain-containing OB-fold protein [Pseudogracilibacillus auburnensis]|uniref:OB-fold protein n=1 Tax=Pseudogracilibacillus auburnensis TaxID=1494959 RepID=A0A2V3VND5_9BACI|nr:Zn-ribbon domain-containing OB-fold protein [Pseudogracilibacillus auburnensis]PXW83363.1 hypothetical protein DFR56_11642 [Pseudogracilibacillus auburnensis]